jgi:hypothetical protein
MSRNSTLKCPAAALFCASAVVLACGNAVPAHDGVAERDSAGVRIIEIAGAFPEWRVSPDTLLRLGVVDGDSSQQFHRVAYAARLPEGRTVVVDGGALEVRWFDASGRHIGTYGRQGEGPGEIRAVGETPLLVGDTIILYDPRNQRVLSLAPGELLSEQPLEGDRQTRLVAVRGRSIVAAAADHEFDVSREYGRSSGTVALLANGPAGIDTLAQLRGEDRALWVRIVDGTPLATVMMDLPFAAPILLAAAGDEIVAVRGDEPQLRVLDLSGEVVRIVRLLADSSRAVTAGDRSGYRTYAVRQAERRGVPAGPADESARARLGLLEEGHRIPVFDRLLVGSDDRVWLRKYRVPWAADEPQVWIIVQPEGSAGGQLVLAPGFELMHADSHFITGVFRDELDVEYVVTFRLER